MVGVQSWEKFIWLYRKCRFFPGYCHCFPWFREERSFHNKCGGVNKGDIKVRLLQQIASKFIQLKALGVFPGSLRVPGSTACSAQHSLGALFDLVPKTQLVCAWNKTADASHLSLLRLAALTIAFLGEVCMPEINFLITGDMRKWSNQKMFHSQKQYYK